MEAPRNTHLALYYDKDGNFLGLETAEGKKAREIEKDELEKDPIVINGVNTTVLFNKPGNTVCCAWINGKMFCWC